MAPGAYPDMYLIEGAAYCNLDRLGESERAARAGIDTDRANLVPRLRKLLGEVLYRKYDYSGALAQFEIHASTAAKAPDVAEVEAKAESCRRLAEILPR